MKIRKCSHRGWLELEYFVKDLSDGTLDSLRHTCFRSSFSRNCIYGLIYGAEGLRNCTQHSMSDISSLI